MKVSELIERLSEFPDYYDVTTGRHDVTDVVAESLIQRGRDIKTGAEALDARPVVVIV